MLGSDRSLFALALLTAAAVGCGGGVTSESTGGEGGGTTSSATGGAGGTTSSSSSTSSVGGSLTCMDGEATTLAVSELIFGDGPSGEWKSVGFNIDGLVSTGVSKDVCKPIAGAVPTTPYPDGDNGIDNSFGKNLLPLILSLYPNWVSDINNGITGGYFTSLLKMECLPPEGDVPLFTSRLFGATELPMNPKWDGTDMWPISPELLSDPMDPNSSTVVFENSSVLGQKYDSGTGETFILTVPLKTMTDTTSIKLTLYAARTTMTLAADRKSATDGTIGGVLNTEEFVAEIKKVGYLLGLCDTTLFNDLLNTVRQASDILVDGTQDPNKECDGISMGLGFKMKQALIGEVAAPAPIGMACQ